CFARSGYDDLPISWDYPSILSDACSRPSHVKECLGKVHLFQERAMDGEGWIAALIIGGVAGWLAEQFMKSDMGLLMNIVLGIIGAAIASAIMSALGIALAGWGRYLIDGFIGACLLIWIARMVRGTRPA